MHHRVTVLAMILTAGSGLAPSAWADPPIEDFTPVSPPEAAIAILPADTPGAAGELGYSARCHPTKQRAAIVDLGWQTAGEQSAGEQRIDISKFPRGLATGRYDTTRRLPGTMTAAAVDSPEPGIAYYWRVLSKTDDGWVASGVERFEVPVCPWDQPDLSGLSGLDGSVAGDSNSGSAAN